MKPIILTNGAAIRLYRSADEAGQKLLTDICGPELFTGDITGRIKTMLDVFDENGISEADFIKSCIGLEDDEVAYREAKLIAKALNEGWVPDYTNSSQPKYEMRLYDYTPGFGFSSAIYDYWHTVTHVGSRLVFKSEKLRAHAAKHFLSVYNRFAC